MTGYGSHNSEEEVVIRLMFDCEIRATASVVESESVGYSFIIYHICIAGRQSLT